MFKQFIEHDPRKEEILFIENFWTEQWNSVSIENDVSHLQHHDYYKVIKRLLPRKARILEAGCGMADWVRFLDRHGYNITGVDISQLTISRIKKKYPQIDVRTGDLQALEFYDNEFDVYLSFGVIEHFENGADAVLSEAYRVLKPGGLLCVSVPYLNKEKQKKYTEKNIFDNLGDLRSDTPKRFYQYVMTKDELVETIEPMGFKVLALYPNCAGHTLKSKSNSIKTVIASTKRSNPIVRFVRPVLKKIWNISISFLPKERYAHMILAIARKEL